MRGLLYRLYVRWMWANVHIRQWLYARYLDGRKEQLDEADLSYLNLQGTNLRNANLRGANLRRSDLTGVDLSNADLSEADLTGARVTEAQLAQAYSLERAILPDGTIFVGEHNKNT